MEDDVKDDDVNFINHYKCPECNYFWQDIWTAQCDDDCPQCGTRHISPYLSEDAIDIK